MIDGHNSGEYIEKLTMLRINLTRHFSPADNCRYLIFVFIYIFFFRIYLKEQRRRNGFKLCNAFGANKIKNAQNIFGERMIFKCLKPMGNGAKNVLPVSDITDQSRMVSGQMILEIQRAIGLKRELTV